MKHKESPKMFISNFLVVSQLDVALVTILIFIGLHVGVLTAIEYNCVCVQLSDFFLTNN
jgi:hypothetical protein